MHPNPFRELEFIPLEKIEPPNALAPTNIILIQRLLQGRCMCQNCVNRTAFTLRQIAAGDVFNGHVAVPQEIPQHVLNEMQTAFSRAYDSPVDPTGRERPLQAASEDSSDARR